MEKKQGEPIGGPLILRHASKRSSGTWGPDDYDVIQDGRDIGRIFKPRAGAPEDLPWMWTITGAIVTPSHGFCASLDEGKAQFAETWRAWLARKMARGSNVEVVSALDDKTVEGRRSGPGRSGKSA